MTNMGNRLTIQMIIAVFPTTSKPLTHTGGEGGRKRKRKKKKDQ